MMPQKTKNSRRNRTKHDSYKEPIQIVARNDSQKAYLKALDEADQVVVVGPAGTGKTFLAASHAAKLYDMKEVDKIVITRPHVPVGKDIGYLPGSLEEKCIPWALPVIDVLEKQLGKNKVENDMKNGNIEIAPLALMRGRSFENCYVLLDECQNLTIENTKNLVTRIGEGSKLVMNGDVQQSDLKGPDGLSRIVGLIKKHNLPIPIIEFGVEDIVRSDICKTWIKIFMEENL